MTGSLYRRGKRGYFTIEFYVPGQGRSRTVRISTHTADRQEAERIYARELAALQARGPVARGHSYTVAEWAAEWLRTRRTQGLDASTIASYDAKLRLYVLPMLGEAALRDLSPDHVRQWLNTLAERSRADGGEGRLSARTLQYAHTLLRAMLQDAVRMGHADRNATDGVRRPRVPRYEARALTEDEARRLLAAAEGTRYAPLWRLLLASGLRIGEALALDWRDIDLDAAVVHVRREATKTDAGARVVEVDGPTLAALRAWRARQAEERLRLGPRWHAGSAVFTGPRGARLDRHNAHADHWTPLLGRAGVGPLRLHDLRHTSGTLALESGHHAREVADRLGHRDSAFFLNRYAHSQPERRRQLAEDMGAVLGGQVGGFSPATPVNGAKLRVHQLRRKGSAKGRNA